jgi:Kdo2-lipid IVA lauroyltransferase/acyltransferase
MKFIGYLFFRFTVFLFSLIPFRLLYILSDGLAWLFFNVVKYRGKVVYGNLKNSFPEKSATEIHEIARKFYKNLTDILLESIKGFSMSEKTMSARYRFLNPELIHNTKSGGGHSIHMAAHYTNWEWGATIYQHWVNQRIMIGFYKPLANKYIETYGHASRSQFGTVLVDIGRTAWAFEEYKDRPTCYILVSDQSTYSDKAHWVKFLNQDTICPHGGDKYAHLYNYPVFYVDIQREKRGHYTVNFELLVENPATLPEGEVTRLFMHRLEEIIKVKPENWLWSHKRWKVKKNLN